MSGVQVIRWWCQATLIDLPGTNSYRCDNIYWFLIWIFVAFHWLHWKKKCARWDDVFHQLRVPHSNGTIHGNRFVIKYILSLCKHHYQFRALNSKGISNVNLSYNATVGANELRYPRPNQWLDSDFSHFQTQIVKLTTNITAPTDCATWLTY